MAEPHIIVRHRGRLGNRMFQAMVALELKRRVPQANIFGLHLPEWGIETPDIDFKGKSFLVTGQTFNLDEISWLLKSGAMSAVILDVWGQRLSYYGPPSKYQNIFKPAAKGQFVSDNQIILNIRAEDILTGWHSKYYPLPFSFYEKIIDMSGLEPVFMGQLDDNDYTSALKDKFQGAIFLPRSSEMEDFETLRRAKNVVLSISTFSWLATWLSAYTESIHLPVAGLFNPLVAQTMLLPANDNRYYFHRISIPDQEERASLSLMEWVKKTHSHDLYEKDELNSIIIDSLTRRRS